MPHHNLRAHEIEEREINQESIFLDD